MKVGMIGLGRTGEGMSRRMIEKGLKFGVIVVVAMRMPVDNMKQDTLVVLLLH